MATVWDVPPSNLVSFFNGTHDLDTDTFNMALFVDGYASGTGTYAVTNEASGTGYSAGGQALAGVTLGEVAGVVTFDANDVQWDATGGSLSARWAVIYNTTGGEILFESDLTDGAGGDLTATNDTFTVAIHANGIFTSTES